MRRLQEGSPTIRRWLTALSVAALFGCSSSPNAAAPSSWPAGQPASSSSGPPLSAGSPACGKAGAKTGALSLHVPVFGKSRSYTLVVPPTYASGTSYPLVYVLHGHGGSGAQARRSLGLESVAGDRAIFVYPDGAGGGWDLDSPASKNPDVAFFDATLAITQSNYCIDLHRVFVTGFSNGADMANQLACRRGDRIRAVASHGGGGPYETAGEYDEQGNLVCKGKPVASLTVHGASDGTVAPSEGQKSIDHWTHANHCSGTAPSNPRACVAHQGCANAVVSCKVPGLGHSVWDQAKQLTWSFFDAQK
jgi:polyhydroxybutyrate depolymerase